MSGRELFRCSKNFPHPDGDQATELLLVQNPYAGPPGAWDARPRCAEHPAADDIPMLRRINPGLKCVVVPLEAADE